MQRKGGWLRAWLILAVLLAGEVPNAFGADLYCSGKVTGVLLYQDGYVMIYGSWRNDWTYVCNTQGSWGTASTEVCLAWYGALLKAKSENTTVQVWYPNENSYGCNALPTYSTSRVPGYVAMLP